MITFSNVMRLRKWLNTNFYNTAFDNLQKTIIGDGDKLFLLSNTEAITYLNVKKANGTDYAKVQGLYVGSSSYATGTSPWWLRTPNSSIDYGVYNVTFEGAIYDYTSCGNTYYGVRPDCIIEDLVFATILSLLVKLSKA